MALALEPLEPLCQRSANKLSSPMVLRRALRCTVQDAGGSPLRRGLRRSPAVQRAM
jgi:hypothetical protein